MLNDVLYVLLGEGRYVIVWVYMAGIFACVCVCVCVCVYVCVCVCVCVLGVRG